ncbi:THxN family PEP-CTERM protein [Nodularia harveyana UHCC-0300]|uniref:THxN family PEP-CTERM protein n=1 Tax=Nodularia harveyana UHCC-0300 TaxID=2974287 RepID=A0ABU5UA14_9CYAN|nr:THxN family PEP-CTERM protein [Nodularia harveyana]MEA5580358.1 THxN family PEP-CTERM protein [Nodularia harveyana UHCC-0300]
MKNSGKSTISTSAFVSAATLSLFLGNAIPAVAADITLNSVTGSWTNPIGGTSLNGLDTNEIRWGTPAAGEQSGFRFDSAVPSSVSISTETNFLLGTLTHFNFPTFSGTFIDAVDLDVSLDIGSTQNFKYTFNIDETSNGLFVSSCPSFQISNTPCDDRITFGSGFTDQTFSIDGEEFTLQLAGFSSTADGLNPISSLVTEENRASTAFLVGRITTPVIERPASTPEPGALIGFSLLGLYGFNRRPKYQQS